MEAGQDKFFHQQSQVSHINYDLETGKINKHYYTKIGLGFEVPEEAKTGGYVDRKCPFTGDVKIRGRILKGEVKSNRMHRSIIVRRDYLHYIPKYKRFEKRHKNVPAHLSPCFHVKPGDKVTIGECRPLSKTIRFNVISTEELDNLNNRKVQEKRDKYEKHWV